MARHFKYVILGGGVAAVRARAPPLSFSLSLRAFNSIRVSPPITGRLS
jgi:hypothetical protein